MSVTTFEEAKEKIAAWLKENGHQVRTVDDQYSNFHFEIDYPLGTLKKQRIIQPKEYPGLVVLLNGVSIAPEHKDKLKGLSEEEKDKFYSDIRKDLMFAENSYDISEEQGIAQQIQFSYEFYFDVLGKTQLFRGLLFNHRTLMYIVTTFNDKFGLPALPDDKKATQTLQ